MKARDRQPAEPPCAARQSGRRDHRWERELDLHTFLGFHTTDRCVDCGLFREDEGVPIQGRFTTRFYREVKP